MIANLNSLLIRIIGVHQQIIEGQNKEVLALLSADNKQDRIRIVEKGQEIYREGIVVIAELMEQFKYEFKQYTGIDFHNEIIH
jgi:hypothetical protein